MTKRLFLAIALAVAVVLPATAQASEELTQGQVDAALDQRREASASLDAMTARFEEAISSEMLTRERIVKLSKSVTKLEQEIGTKRVQVKELVRARYMSGGSLGTERVFTARNFTDLPLQDQYYQLMNAKDLTLLHGLESAEALHIEQQLLLDQTLVEQEALVVEIGGLTEQIVGQLEKADADYNSIAVAFEKQEAEKRRKAEEERKRREEAARRAADEAARQATSTTIAVSTSIISPTTTAAPPTTTAGVIPTTSLTTSTQPTTTTTTRPPAPPPVVTSGKSCPINAATSFTDSWGAPRSGGRSHKGVDMMAARGAPLVAIESGTITRTSNSSLGGISIYLTGASGNHYYYAHLDALAPGVGGGMNVSVGELVGYNGSSGNASYSAPHLHFQYAPPGSTWINPYPLVKALCG